MVPIRLLFLGDVVGRPGLEALRKGLPELAARTGAHLVVANGENSAGGLGITPATARAMRDAGVDVITTGNHVWDRKEILGSLDDMPWVVRPENYPPGTPGRGWFVARTRLGPVGVVNLSGRIFMDPLDCPFRTADAVLAGLPPEVRVVLVDFHAEATSEKRALGWFLDGRVTAVVGTHTHVATADAQVLPGGTGYMTDVGMTGVADSVIGVDREAAVRRFVSQMPRRLGVSEGLAVACGVLVDADTDTGRCLAMERVEWRPGSA